ncbi:MAG: hypothetical protein WD737_00860 [Gemmatimonadota bacterium]
MFIRRDRRAPNRYTAVRVGLFFFAAGLWLAGVVVENETVTTAAMIVAVLAIFLGLVLRRRAMTAEAAADREADPEVGG